MKKIYIILTVTGTCLSRLIKMYTKDEFSHVSIALDSKLNEMYSFGRLKPYNPFIAGFVHERKNKGTFKRFFNTSCVIYELEIEDEKYNKLKNIIIDFKKKRRELSFNIIGLFLVGLNIKYRKNNSFYCAEFVKYVMDRSNINANLPIIIRPENFKNIEGTKVVYKGLLRNYSYKPVYEIMEYKK